MSGKLRFRHVEGFRAVVQTGTATGAASLLNVTQPAVSQLMSEFEAIVGFPLFDRRGGRLVPTSMASMLFDEIDRCFTGLHHVDSYCAQLRESQSHAITIAAIPNMSLTLLPIAIGRYRRDVAKDFFTLFSRHSDDAFHLVGTQKADIGFGSKPISLPGIECEPISSYTAICALPPDDSLASKSEISVKDLDGKPFIATSRSEASYERFQALFLSEKVQVSTVMECPMVAAACALVENGIGITLIEQCAATFFAGRNIALRRLVPEVPITYYAYWLKKPEPRFKLSTFISILREEGRKMSEALDKRLDTATAKLGH